ncbi:endo-1,3(4)-beta-glucanase [Massariosphaeria phaeospora]|uniref:glucan endo-1,3-beta-D-glucosidase n=1 Tax=Massariosphaeria phaeospora TaxID=100035 RepID=A0A7C8I9W9_9PLEO|nr:endo-1,3(4)-beta-glucanase [Massariosphaeria phaeospora]
MGQRHSIYSPSITDKKESWQHSLLTSIGVGTTASETDKIPPDNIFVPIQQDNILPQVPIGAHHPVPRKGIEDDDYRTLHTNKFYANTFLGEQNQPVWTQPYSIWWGKGSKEVGQLPTWGMGIAHIETEDLVYGEGDPAKHYVNPPRRQSLVLSARELDFNTTLTTDTHLPFSVNINLNHKTTHIEPKLTFPVVQGMSFITGGYRSASPIIQCPGPGFNFVSEPIHVGRSTKYRIKDANSRDWVIYVNPIPHFPYNASAFRRVDANTLLGPPFFKGTIQIARNPLGAEGESLYDKATGAFACEVLLTATVSEARGTYSFSYTKIGTSPLLMFALPHHIQSLDPDLRPQITRLQLRTPAKGLATAVWGDKLTFIEPALPITMSFGAWTPTLGPGKMKFAPDVHAFIAAIADRELRQLMAQDILSTASYFTAGKHVAKLATLIWVLKDVLNDAARTAAGLERLKLLLERYVANRQRYPLYYDDCWKGVVSYSGFTEPAADGGNTYYSDHHVHWAGFVYAAAVVAYLDAEWLRQGENRAWTNMLVKDFAESDYAGRDYPFSRSFDWWAGHSWGKGLIESADGRVVDSAGEDGFASLAIKMWGRVVGDVNMEKRGELWMEVLLPCLRLSASPFLPFSSSSKRSSQAVLTSFISIQATSCSPSSPAPSPPTSSSSRTTQYTRRASRPTSA